MTAEDHSSLTHLLGCCLLVPRAQVTLMQQLEQNKGGSESSSNIQLRDKLKSVEAQLDRLRWVGGHMLLPSSLAERRA